MCDSDLRQIALALDAKAACDDMSLAELLDQLKEELVLHTLENVHSFTEGGVVFGISRQAFQQYVTSATRTRHFKKDPRFKKRGRGGRRA